MKVLFWTAGLLFCLLAAPMLVSFLLHLSTGEAVPLARAKALYRWCVVVVLGTFNIAIFTRVFQGLYDIIRS